MSKSSVLISYPSKYPLSIYLVGLITDTNFQALKHELMLMIDRLTVPHRPKAQIRAMLEFDWSEYVTKLCREFGKKAYMRRGELAVFWNGTYIGDQVDFKYLTSTEYQYVRCDPEPRHLYYTTMAQEERFAYFNRDPDRSFVYFDIKYGNIEGRLVFELYSDLLPDTCDNFMRLCLNHPIEEKSLSYLGSHIHRIVGSGWIQGGIVIYESEMQPAIKLELPDESYAVSHDRRGVLSMCNDGKHTNGTQFFVTLQPSQWMDKYYVAIGQLIEGNAFLRKLEFSGQMHERPQKTPTVCNCGVLPFGRGVVIKQEFIYFLSQKVAGKWKKFLLEVSAKKERGSDISVTDELLVELKRADQDIDTNSHYIVEKMIQNAPSKHSEPTLTQYLIVLIMDIVMQAINLHEVQEDVINIGDTSSEVLLEENYLNNLYSNLYSDNNHFMELLDISLESGFICKAIKYRKQLVEQQVLPSNVLIIKGEDVEDECSEGSISIKDYRARSLVITNKVRDDLLQSITKLIDTAFKYVKPTDIGKFDKDDKDFDSQVVEGIIDELLVRVTGLHKRKQISTPIKEKTLRFLTINFVKSLLEEALLLHQKYLRGEKVELRKRHSSAA